MLTVAQALQAVLERVKVLEPAEVGIDEALGLVLAADIVAQEDLPPFVNSAMDGFALRAEDLAQASDTSVVRLRVVDDQPAGQVSSRSVGPGTALRIMTGASLPAGAHPVVPVEQVTTEGDWVSLRRPVRPGANIRQAGEDVRRGETVLRAGTPLRPAELSLLAALGHAQVKVIPVPRVVVMTTGNELVHVSQPLGPGQIRDANLHGLCAQVRAAGAMALPVARVRDEPEALEAALRRALDHADVILTNGGISMGDHDHLKPVLAGLGAEQVFWQIAQKPGRPMAFSLFKGRPVFGIPGNPVAAQICFEVYVRPALRKLMGHVQLFRPERTAILAEDLRKPAGDGRVHFLRVLLRRDGDRLLATSTGPQGSGLLSSMTRAQALAILPEGAVDPRAGSPVQLLMTDETEDR